MIGNSKSILSLTQISLSFLALSPLRFSKLTIHESMSYLNDSISFNVQVIIFHLQMTKYINVKKRKTNNKSSSNVVLQ